MTDSISELAAEAAEMAASPPPADKLEQLQALAAEVNKLDVELADAEATTKRLAARRLAILTGEMVELMDAAHVQSITVGNRPFVLSDYYHASIKEENRDKAHNWLEQDGSGDIIKHVVTVTFSRQATKDVAKLRAWVAKNLKSAELKEKREVPWARLTSWLKEEYAARLRPGNKAAPLPLALLGATVGRVVKVKEEKSRE